MKIIIKTMYNKYEIEYDTSISTNIIIEKIAEIEKVNKQNIVVFYNNTVIKYSINESYITNDCNIYAIIQAIS
jgi:hypothetical protein